MTDWATEDLGFFVRIVTQQIAPAAFPDETFSHYSLPAFDATGGPLAQEGRSIESGKFRLGQPAVLVSKLNPRKMRVQTFESAGGRRAVASTEFMVYVPRVDGLDLHYLKHLLSSTRFAQRLQAVATGTTNSHVRVKPSETLRWPVWVPPLEEQRRIAEILDTIDETIQATERVIAKLRVVKEGLTQSLPLEGGLAHETASRELPEGWRYLTLDEVAVNHDGRRVPIRSEDRLERGGSYPYYGASGVIDHIDDYLFDGTFVLLGEDGENVLSRSTPLAFVATGRIWVNNHAHVLETRSEVDSRFLARVLERTDYAAIASGSAQPKITQLGLRRMRFPMPSHEMQKELCDKLEIIEDRVASEIHHAAGLEAVRTGLAADLLSGRVRTVAA